MLIASLCVAGALGACGRYLVGVAVQSRAGSRFPFGTVVVNVLGAFALGLVAGWAMYHGLSRLPRVALGTGLCGAFTTYSTFSYETIRLFEERGILAAVRNLTVSLVAGLLAAGAGLAIMAAV